MSSVRDGIVTAARRILPAALLFVLVSATVGILSGLDVPMIDAVAKRNYGTFAIYIAAGLLATRVIDFLLFDVGYRLRRGTSAPALLRQLTSVVIFGLIVAVLFQVLLSTNLTAIL